jgi:hypothetical protein
MTKMTKTRTETTKTKKTARKKPGGRAEQLDLIRTSLENLTDLFTSSAQENFTHADLVILGGDLREAEGYVVQRLHARLLVNKAEKKTAAKRR